MTTAMPPLDTPRLRIRPFVRADLDRVHEILDVDFAEREEGMSREARAAWLDWSIANHEQLGNMYQPPYGEKAVVLRESSQLVAVCGLVPCLGPYGQLSLPPDASPAAVPWTPEVGLFYAVSRSQRGQGYATEAATALIEYAFAHLHLGRIIATTTYDNVGSMGVMRRLGMTILRNPFPEPPWLQVVGVLSPPWGQLRSESLVEL